MYLNVTKCICVCVHSHSLTTMQEVCWFFTLRLHLSSNVRSTYNIIAYKDSNKKYKNICCSFSVSHFCCCRLLLLLLLLVLLLFVAISLPLLMPRQTPNDLVLLFVIVFVFISFIIIVFFVVVVGIVILYCAPTCNSHFYRIAALYNFLPSQTGFFSVSIYPLDSNSF